MSWLQRVWDRIVISTARTTPEPDSTDIHFSPDLTALPLCGVRLGAPYARNIEAVTCPKCKELGMPIVIQYDVSSR